MENEKKPCTVYIDESGDLGIRRGTRWFVLTAVVVDKENEMLIRETIDKIRLKLNVRDIHLQKITDFYKRSYIVRELSKMPFTYMSVLVDTNKFDDKKIPSPLIAYNYICKYALQRASWFMRDTNRTGKVVLSARGTSRDGELIDYIENKLLPSEESRITANIIPGTKAEHASFWDMLQLADVCATSTFLSHELNGLGFTHPCFAYMLAEHLYRGKGGKLISYGLKYFKNDMQPTPEEIKRNRVCGMQ